MGSLWARNKIYGPFVIVPSPSPPPQCLYMQITNFHSMYPSSTDSGHVSLVIRSIWKRYPELFPLLVKDPSTLMNSSFSFNFNYSPNYRSVHSTPGLQSSSTTTIETRNAPVTLPVGNTGWCQMDSNTVTGTLYPGLEREPPPSPPSPLSLREEMINDLAPFLFAEV